MKGISSSELYKNCGEKLTLNDVHKVLFEMLIEIDKFCKKHSIRYFLGDGTLLGAVREHGFIPWDDDADIYMLREDYNKFVMFASVSDNLDIVTSNSEKYYHPFPYADVADNRTYHISNMLKINTGKGQFVDIFPIDNIPDSHVLEKKQNKSLRILIHLRRLCISSYKENSSIYNFIYNLAVLVCRMFNEYKITHEIEKIASKYSNTRTEKVGILAFSDGKRFQFKSDWFIDSERCNFTVDDTTYFFSIPKCFHEILTTKYGDYMTPPPDDQKVGHHYIDVYWKKHNSEGEKVEIFT